MKNRILFISLAVVLALSVGLIGCEGVEEEPDKIYILAVRSQEGALSYFEETAMGPNYKLWEKKVNAAGGIYVPEFGKKLPVQIDTKNDGSDMDMMETLLNSNLATGKYNFVIGPCCTAFLEAAGPICSYYHAVMVGAEGGATSLTLLDPVTGKPKIATYPYMFCNLSFANWNQIYELCRIMDGWAENEDDGLVDVYVMYIADQHGYEYSDEFRKEAWASHNDTINIIAEEPTPFPAGSDEDAVKALVDDAASKEADVVCIFAYPPDPMTVVGYAWGMYAYDTTGNANYNFKGIVTGPAACYEGFYDPTTDPPGFGDVAIGVCGFGAWNEYSSSGLLQYTKDFVGEWGRELIDWWGGQYYYAGLQMLEAGIAAADEYSGESVREAMASTSPTDGFPTILGDNTYYTKPDGSYPLGTSGGLLAIACHQGEVGQWQHVTEANGWLPDDATGTNRTKPVGIADNAIEWAIFEVISLDHPSADWLYPKPAWPVPE